MALSQVVGTVTTPTSAVILPLLGENQASVLVYGTYTGVTFSFQGSIDGVHYAPIQALRADTWQTETGNLTMPSSQSRLWYIVCGPITHLKVLASAYSTGTMNVVMNNSPGTVPVVPGTALQLVTTSGKQTGTAAAGTTGANEVIFAAPCILHRLIVTTAGTASLILYDNATTNSGTILYASPATYSLGTVTEINVPAAAGVTARKQSGSAAVTAVVTPL